AVSGTGPALTAWHHLAWTFDTGKTTLFLDGVSTAVSTTAPSTLVDDPTSTLTVGCHPGSTIYPFQGVIDEMRVYDRALTASEITSLAQ
ncbi:MAG TPA: LamG domain-containing protein, partial [Polyangiaceae bacterium]